MDVRAVVCGEVRWASKGTKDIICAKLYASYVYCVYLHTYLGPLILPHLPPPTHSVKIYDDRITDSINLYHPRLLLFKPAFLIRNFQKIGEQLKLWTRPHYRISQMSSG